MIPTRTVAWTAGVKPHPIVAELGLPLDDAGRIKVDRYCQVEGFDDVWAIGDAAAVPDPARPGQPSPPTCQHAIRQGRTVGANVAAALGEGPKKPFTYKTLGVFVDMGRYQAVAETARDPLARLPGVVPRAQLPPADDAGHPPPRPAGRPTGRSACCSGATRRSWDSSGTRRSSRPPGSSEQQRGRHGARRLGQPRGRERALTLAALVLVLGSAAVHALWNALLADAEDTHATTAVMLVSGVVLFAPVAALTWDVDGAALPYVLASGTLELVYFGLLATAYSRAELTFVYPVARGSAPVIVLVVSVAALGAAVSGLQAAGVLVVAAGVLLVRGLGRGRGADLALALAVGACIAGYTLVDDHGLAHAAPIGYLTLVLVVAAIPYAAIVGPAAMRRAALAARRAGGRADVRRLRARPGGAGAGGGGARRRAARDERGHGRDRRRGLGPLEGAGHARAGRGPGRGRGGRDRAGVGASANVNGGWVGRRLPPGTPRSPVEAMDSSG